MIDLDPRHLAMVIEVLDATVPEAEVHAFGSRATGTAKAHSDLDLVIKGDSLTDKATLRKCRTAFEESDLPFRVDVVDWMAADASFKEIIEKQMVRVPRKGTAE